MKMKLNSQKNKVRYSFYVTQKEKTTSLILMDHNHEVGELTEGDVEGKQESIEDII